jgi:hypothetical protein
MDKVTSVLAALLVIGAAAFAVTLVLEKPADHGIMAQSVITSATPLPVTASSSPRLLLHVPQLPASR